MNRRAKWGWVIVGYVVAVAAAVLAARWYDARMAAQPFDTSGGMYAGGQLLSSLGAFLIVALVPTALALWFLRRHEPSWNAVAWAALAFASAGLVAVLMPLVFHDNKHGAFVFTSLLALSQLLGVPLWLGVFTVLALLAPFPAAKRNLLAAAGVELAIALCAAVHWIMPLPPF